MSKRARSEPEASTDLLNLVDGVFKPSVSGEWLDVESPTTGTTCRRVTLSTAADVDEAVAAAKAAFPAWSRLTVKRRAAIMFKFHELLDTHADELAELVVMENGKNKGEAIAGVAKGNETVEWACSLPQLVQGKYLQVSGGITCHEVRDPIGVVACVVPFNFPAMVPMWTAPIALTCGNCVIVKPSEKVPATMTRMAELLLEAGVPKGVFQIVNGTAPVVNALCDHPDIAGLTFVGSSRVAKIVADRCQSLGKKCIALGGAKNHLIALGDCEIESASSDIVASFSGCAGQRCMAASALLLVGENKPLLDRIIERASKLEAGTAAGQVGAVIDAASKARILKYITDAEAGGARILLDGRSWGEKAPGHWVGPTVILHSSADDAAMKEEIFGPVISVFQVATWEEAIAIENGNPHGNAASIYTTIGAHADWFTSRFRAGMIGVNIGVPVPREPFSFGGLFGTSSKYGGGYDVTGDGAMEFFTNRRKVTTRWPAPAAQPVAAGAGSSAGVDKASFVGTM